MFISANNDAWNLYWKITGDFQESLEHNLDAKCIGFFPVIADNDDLYDSLWEYGKFHYMPLMRMDDWYYFYSEATGRIDFRDFSEDFLKEDADRTIIIAEEMVRSWRLSARTYEEIVPL